MKFSRSIQKLVNRAERALGFKRSPSAPKRPARKSTAAMRRKAMLAKTPPKVRREVANLRKRGVALSRAQVNRSKSEVKQGRARVLERLRALKGYIIEDWERIGQKRNALYVSELPNGATVAKAIIEPPNSQYNHSVLFHWLTETEYGGLLEEGDGVSLTDAKQGAEASLWKNRGRFHHGGVP